MKQNKIVYTAAPIPVIGYNIRRVRASGEKSAKPLNGNVPVVGLSFTDNNVADDVAYTYEVKPVNLDGKEEEFFSHVLSVESSASLVSVPTAVMLEHNPITVVVAETAESRSRKLYPNLGAQSQDWYLTHQK